MTSLPQQIQNIWAVGRNYGEHAKELGNQVPTGESAPMIFLKAGSTIVENGAEFSLPAFSQDIHHETELALRFGPDFQFIEFTLALDLTAREVQNKLKTQGHPWTLAKSFRASCPLGSWQRIPPGLNLQDLHFRLKVNGELRQTGHTADMIHSIEKLRLYVLERFPVVPGDALLTGTPAGVGLIRPGDLLEAEIPGTLKAVWRVQR